MRRRIENGMLRWQARLDSEAWDRWLPWIFAAMIFGVLVSLSLAQARSLEDGADLGTYTQAAYLVTENGDPTVTIQGGTHVLAQQAAFLFYAVAWLTSFLPIIPTLLVLQSAALAIGAVPLWRIARRLANLRVGAAAALVWAYALYPAVHSLNVSDFHPETVAVPALLFACLYGLSGRWILYAVACTVAVLSRADLALAIAGLGGLLAYEGKRKAGVLTLTAGVAYTALAVLVIQPGYAGGTYAHVDSFVAYGDTPAGILAGMATSPMQVLTDLTLQENFSVIVFLLAPVFFLPVLAPRYLLPVVPLQAIYLISDVPTEARFGQQTVAITAFVFLATAFALRKIGREGVERVTVDRRVLWALVLVATVFFVRDSPSTPYERPWAWGGRDAVDLARLDAVDLVGDGDSVRAAPALLPLLAERHDAFLLDLESRPDLRDAIEMPSDGSVPPEQRGRVDVIVYDDSAAESWNEDERRAFREGLVRQSYERVYAVEGVEVWVNTAS